MTQGSLHQVGISSSAEDARGWPRLLQTLRERERRGPSGQLAAELLTDMEALLGEGAALLGEYRRVSAGAERSARAAGSAAPPSEDSAEAWVAAAVADPGPGQADPPVFGQPSVAYPLPPPCSLLAPGVSFEGVQQVATLAGRRKTEGQWKVGVTLHSYDPGSGSIAGSMSSSLPNEAVPVSTFFEGEVVDNVNHTFFTAGWDATSQSDLRHWCRLPGYSALHSEVVASRGRAAGLVGHPWVYMRWKEQFFVTRGSECRLSIAGFYYLALHRTTGEVAGLYFDPSSSPDQALTLGLARPSEAGFAFASFEVA